MDAWPIALPFNVSAHPAEPDPDQGRETQCKCPRVVKKRREEVIEFTSAFKRNYGVQFIEILLKYSNQYVLLHIEDLLNDDVDWIQ